MLELERARAKRGSRDGEALQQNRIQGNVHLHLIPHRISNTRPLQEADDHHSAVLRQQLDVLLRVVAADEIENHIDASVAHLTNRTFTSSWSRP